MELASITVYCINADDLPEDVYMSDISDDEFIIQADKVGCSFSLPEFQEAFNNGDISDQWYIKVFTNKP